VRLLNNWIPDPRPKRDQAHEATQLSRKSRTQAHQAWLEALGAYRPRSTPTRRGQLGAGAPHRVVAGGVANEQSALHCADGSSIAPGSDARRRGLNFPMSFVHRFIALLQTWRQRLRGRRELVAMCDDRLLRDIGLTRYEVELELHKPFWRE